MLSHYYADTKILKPLPIRSTLAFVQFAEDNAELDVVADLTFKQAITSSHSRFTKHRITEDIATKNIADFLDRLNYKIYKNAYRRYDKKLHCLTAIEGGAGLLREHRSQTD